MSRRRGFEDCARAIEAAIAAKQAGNAGSEEKVHKIFA
jgi:hypothetical protein